MKRVVRTGEEAHRFVSRAITKLTESFDPHLITMVKYKPPRSLPQNARCHAMIRELADYVGYSEAELKEWLKLEYGYLKGVTIGGKEKLIAKSTAEFNKQEMTDFMAHIERIGAELNFTFTNEDAESHQGRSQG